MCVCVCVCVCACVCSKLEAADVPAMNVYDRSRYDDCGEANIQSYSKYFAMKDALVAAYGSDTPIDYYSYVSARA